MATMSALQVRHHHVEHAVITPTNHSCFVCIESDGIVGNFSARQQEPKELVPTLHRTNPNPPSQGYALGPTNPNALSQVPTEELLLELRRRIIAPRDTRHEAWDDWGGLDPRGDWPEQG